MNRTSIDRRPRFKVTLWNGGYTAGNPLGWGNDYENDATVGNDIADAIDFIWDRGGRRFTLNRPGSSVPADSGTIGASCWYINGATRRNSLLTQLAPRWAPRMAQGGELGLYNGLNTPDSHSLTDPCLGPNAGDPNNYAACPANSPHHTPDLDDPDDAAYWTANLSPWVLQIGVRAFDADNYSTVPKFPSFAAWADEMQGGFIGGLAVKCGSEGIVNDSHLPDPTRIEQYVFCAIEEFVQSHESDAGQVWTVDPFLTEIHILVRTSMTRSEKKARLRNGFILDDWGADDGTILELTRANDVQSLAAVRSGDDVELDWATPAPLLEYDNATPIEVQLYEVCRGPTNEGPWTLVADTTDTEYTDTPPAGTWYYRVRTWTEYNATSPGAVVLESAGGGDAAVAGEAPPYRPRLAVLQAAVAAAAGIDGGRFTVNRGPVNWTTWNWDEHPFACVIEFANFDLFPAAGEMFHSGDLQIAFVTRPPKSDGVRGVNDLAVDRLAQDAELFLTRLLGARRPDGAPVVARLVDADPPEVHEFPSPDYSVMGIELSIRIEY